jgi:hypothetical protein
MEGVFREKRLKDSKCRLLIPAYDVVAGRVYLFKTRHGPRFIFDEDALALQQRLPRRFLSRRKSQRILGPFTLSEASGVIVPLWPP